MTAGLQIKMRNRCLNVARLIAVQAYSFVCLYTLWAGNVDNL